MTTPQDTSAGADEAPSALAGEGTSNVEQLALEAPGRRDYTWPQRAFFAVLAVPIVVTIGLGFGLRFVEDADLPTVSAYELTFIVAATISLLEFLGLVFCCTCGLLPAGQ